MHLLKKVASALFISLVHLGSAENTIAVAAESASLSLYATAFHKSPNDWNFYGIGGLWYDKDTEIWAGISEGNPGAGLQKNIEEPKLFTFLVNWLLEESQNETSAGGTLDIQSKDAVTPGDGLKAEGITRVPCTDGSDFQFWLVSEANSNTAETNSYFSKNFGHPDLNTFEPNSVRNSRFIRVGSNGTLLEEVAIPEFMLCENFDPREGNCLCSSPSL